MIIIMAIFLNSFYWPYEEVSKRKILMWMIVCCGILIVPVLVVKLEARSEFASKIIENIVNVKDGVRKNRKRIGVFGVVGIIGLAGSYIMTHILSRVLLQKTFNIRLFYVFVILLFLGLFLTYVWKDAASKVEKIFLIIALSLGVFCIGVTADRVGIAWDDQIHYLRTLNVSNFLNGIMYEADYTNINNTPQYGGTGYDRYSNYEYIESIETIYDSKACQMNHFDNFGVWSLSYVPSALGIVLGRGLNMSYIGVLNMGRLFNLIMYISLIYWSIKRVKYGKVLIATIGLIPTTIFLASNYSYDPWLTGFVILGYAYFFGTLQENTQLKNRDIVVMIGSIGVGCLPKAIYFPLLFPLFFMPKGRFRDDRQKRSYYLATIGMILFLIATFLLPILIGGIGVGDVRGGADVNATEQIKFILNNPMAYIKILFSFGADYISINNAESMLQAYAYSGNGRFYGLVSMMLAVIAFLDKGQDEKEYRLIKVAGILSCSITILLSITALYISFTAVGAGTVAGMQARYIIPTIFPALYCLGVGGTRHKIEQNTFVCLPMLIIAFTMIYNLTKFWVIPY